MTFAVLRNNSEADGPIVPPLREDGRAFRYCMFFDGNAKVAFADEQEDIYDVLIPGYLTMEEPEQAYQRIRLGQMAAAVIQAEILADVDPSEVSEEEWSILTAPRGLAQPRADWWTCPVPLVVVETGYEPFTAIPRPASGLSDGIAMAENLWWIRPAEDEDFIISLHEVGFIRLMENTEIGY
jgi:hypothetical protein